MRRSSDVIINHNRTTWRLHEPPVAVKTIRCNATADGDNTVIAAVTGMKIRILSMYVTGLGTGGVVTFKTGASTLFTYFLGNTSFAHFDPGPYYICETAAGEAFIVNNPASLDTIGTITYCEVPAY